MTMAFAPPQPAYSGGRRSFSVGKLFLLGEEDAIPACARNGLEYIACTFLPTMKKSRSDARLPTANDSPFGGGDELSFHISSAPSNTAGICLVDTDGDACGGAGACCGGTPRSGAATDGAASAHGLTCCAAGGTGLQHSASSSTGLSCDSGTSSPPLFPAQPADAIPPPAASASASAAASALPLAASPHAPSAGGGLAAAAAAAPASSAAAAAKAEASREALLAACGGAEGLMGAFGILTNDQWTTLQAAVAGAAAARAATAAAAAGSSEDEDHGHPRLLRSGRPSVEVPSARPSAEFARPSAGSSARPSLDRSDGGGSGAPRSTGSGAERADSATSIASLWAAVTAAASSNRSDAAALQAAAAAAAAASGAVYDSSDDAQHDGQDYVAAVRAAMAAPPSVPPAGDALSGYRRQGSSSLRSGPAAIDTSTHHHSHHHSHGHGHSSHSHSHGRAPTAYHSTPQQYQHPQPDMAARFTHSFHPLSAGSGSARTSSDLTPHAETETPPSPHASRPAAPAPSPFVASHMTHQRCPTLHAYYSHVPYSSASDDPYGAHGARAHAGPTSLDRASHGSGHASHGHGHSTHASGVAAGAQGAAAAASGHLSVVARQNSHTSVGSSGSGFHSGIDAPAQAQVQGHSHVAASHGHAHGHVLSASHSMSHSRRHMHGPSGLAVRTDAHDDLGLAPGSAHSQAHSGPGSGSAPRSPHTGLPGFSGLNINTQPRQPQATSGVSSPRRLSAISVYPNGNGSSQLSAGPTSYTTYGYRRACSSLAAMEPGAQTNSVSIEDSSSDDETEEATRRITAGYKTHTGMVRSSGWGLLGADSAPTTPTGEAARHRETWAAGANSGNLASALGGDEGKLGGEGEDGAGALNRKRGSYHLTNSHAAVELFLRLNHARQTMDFVKRQTQLFGAMDKAQMGVWEALHTLNELREYEAVLMAEGNEAQDLSELPLLDHAFQTAELCRLHHPDMDWLHLVGLIHGLGKLLAHRKFGSQPQWAICGETYPLGCRFSPHILGSQYFTANPDRRRRAYNTQTGIYNPGCGLLSVVMSWSAPEYLYLILLLNRAPMPEDALWVLRHAKFTTLSRPHSCYLPLCSREDMRRLPLLRSFQTLAAYRRQELPPGFALEGEARTAYYTGLIHKYIGAGNLHW
ncbi:hypothetical protein HYH03_013803 [Edaphochlamys debaryana]|uniref:Inositol oxygenase n=1 Tax=Edaphochlamys debaryana TaxID=47281 RepID=A0A835XQ58_9CHLO|nr:hypothetical protein HYH03_013803 [Edaphochlamys debaryana]|eukprot:KAG2487522.1 hypothetical protein HYH03_013803 [Edaphochlamys debaryana]